MEDTFRALGQLLIQSLPTFFLVLFLYVFLKQAFFGPLEQTLAKRREATEGARQRAAAALESANAKAAKYEEQIRAARNEIYGEQEKERTRWRAEQAAQVADARKRAETSVSGAKSHLADQASEARELLEGEARTLAARITDAILKGKPA